jgi:hypothetical protein
VPKGVDTPRPVIVRFFAIIRCLILMT